MHKSPFPGRPTILIILLCFSIALIACQQTPPVVKIGLVAPFEGQDRAVGYDAIYSARLAVREINKANANGPGIGRYRVALTALDDGSDPELAAEVAAALAVDPDVVAVVGHWLPETTAAAAPIYQEAGLPFIAVGERPFLPTPAEELPANFLADYAAVTPFDEIAGPYAGPTYDAFYLLFNAVEELSQEGTPLQRQTLLAALQTLRYEGITGDVFQPN